jgi:hypothetical protein
MLATLFAPQNDNRVFLVLAALNAVIYGICWFCNRESRFVRHLVFASVVMFVAGLPVPAMHWATPHFNRGNYLVAGVAVYLLLCTVMSRNPRLGLVGALVTSIAVAIGLGKTPMALHWALQSGMAFLLLHSLRWEDSKHLGAARVRMATAVVWVAHSVLWARLGGDWWMVCVPATVVLSGYFLTRLFRGQWESLVLPIAAVLAALSGPGDALFAVLQRAPSGLLGVAGSFFLFAIGTAAALTKHRWHHAEVKP